MGSSLPSSASGCENWEPGADRPEVFHIGSDEEVIPLHLPVVPYEWDTPRVAPPEYDTPCLSQLFVPPLNISHVQVPNHAGGVSLSQLAPGATTPGDLAGQERLLEEARVRVQHDLAQAQAMAQAQDDALAHGSACPALTQLCTTRQGRVQARPWLTLSLFSPWPGSYAHAMPNWRRLGFTTHTNIIYTTQFSTNVYNIPNLFRR